MPPHGSCRAQLACPSAALLPTPTRIVHRTRLASTSTHPHAKDVCSDVLLTSQLILVIIPNHCCAKGSRKGVGALRFPLGIGSRASPPEPSRSGNEQTDRGAQDERSARAVGPSEPSGQDIAGGQGAVEEE